MILTLEKRRNIPKLKNVTAKQFVIDIFDLWKLVDNSIESKWIQRLVINHKPGECHGEAICYRYF